MKQSLYGLRIGSDANQKRRQTVPSPGIVGEGVETGWRASLVDEGTVRLSSKGESDRITQGRRFKSAPRNHERHCRNAVAFARSDSQTKGSVDSWHAHQSFHRLSNHNLRPTDF